MLFGNKNDGQNDTPAGTLQAAADVIFDVGAEDFEARVLQASMEKPVLVEFWAPWCGPCKQLMPMLEKAVQAAGGAVLMAKVNLDENQELAAALRIQSVPTVFGFFQGRPVDAFQGMVPESRIKGFIDKLVEAARQARPDAIDVPEALKAAGQAVSEGDFGTAQAIYAQILQQDEKNVQAYVGLVRLYIAADEVDQAKQMVEHAPDEIAANPTFGEAKTALELAHAHPKGAVDELSAKVEADPKNHRARMDLALALFAAGQKELAIDHLLESIIIDRDWHEGAARKQLLKFFEALGQSDPLVVAGRRKLSSILFS